MAKNIEGFRRGPVAAFASAWAVPVRVLGLLAVTGVLAACSKAVQAPEPIRSVRSVVVAPSAAASKQDFAAEIRARTESRLGFRVGGKLIERPVQVGDIGTQRSALGAAGPARLALG